jgi:hypothetical protein
MNVAVLVALGNGTGIDGERNLPMASRNRRSDVFIDRPIKKRIKFATDHQIRVELFQTKIVAS